MNYHDRYFVVRNIQRVVINAYYAHVEFAIVFHKYCYKYINYFLEFRDEIFRRFFERYFIKRRHDIFFDRREFFFQINERVLVILNERRICRFDKKQLNENIV